ncbi:MAG: alpha/beta fold hydrolase [Leptolyngbya sp. SIO1D8]|nr:alpha/beta fold hydrolase [Leptolyngbya sp. SIO1D8]
MSVATAETVVDRTWPWQGFPIRYQSAGHQGAPILLIHGFGASSDHWRKNIPVLAKTNRVYAIDLIGFGKSVKPSPGSPIEYTFETWAQLIIDFCRDVIGEATFLIGNSIGCVVAMQAAVSAKAQVRGVAMLDCSLRLLHDRKRLTLPWYRSAPVPLFQKLLGIRPIGHFFFSRLARPKVIRNVLKQAYSREEAVTDELVNILLEPAKDPGAADVFLAFVRYSQGPLPEDLLPHLHCPTLIIWGAEDPWEPIAQGRELANYPAVEDFITLEEVGHCPQDEAPEQVNLILQKWIAHHDVGSE